MNKKITVVIPTYNRARLLKETIASVLNQTYKNFDLLICDNASIDNTLEIIKEFNDERIIYHRHESNIGLQQNWKFALTTPKTTFVALLSDDDLYLPHHLEQGIALMEKNIKASIYACSTQIIGNRQSEPLKPNWATLKEQIYNVNPNVHFSNWLKGTQVASPSLIIRTHYLEYIKEWGGENWPACMDYLWWGQLAMVGDFIFNTMPGALYRWHENNISNDWYKNTRWSASEFRYTVRTLSNLAYEKGILQPKDLIDEVMKWSPSEAAILVLSLSTSENVPELRNAALNIFKLRSDLKQKKSSGHTWLAGIIGNWYLRFADLLDRQIAGWPPKA